MPSVGMRRSTRVLVVKGADGARVLRSGRRLWPDSDACSFQNSAAAVFGDGCGVFKSDCKPVSKQDRAAPTANDDEAGVVLVPSEAAESSNDPKLIALHDEPSACKSWGVVYRRKRKGLSSHRSESNGIVTDDDGSWRRSPQHQDMMYGQHFVRRQKRMMSKSGRVGQWPHGRLAFAASFDSTVGDPSQFVRSLSSLLSYMTRVRVSCRKLAALLTTGAIHEVFSSHGTYFSRDLPCSGSGIFKFFGTIHSVPVFSLDFSAIPPFILYVQIDMLLRSRILLRTYPIEKVKKMEIDANEGEDLPCISSHAIIPGFGGGTESVISASAPPKKRRISRHGSLPLRSSVRNAQHRNGYSPVFQTKRRSIRPVRVGSSSSAARHKSNEHLLSSFFNIKGSHSHITSILSDCHPAKRFPLPNSKELNSTLAGVRENVGSSTCCSANILISKLDKCYREEGANVMLESIGLKQCVLAVKKDGRVRYSHAAQKVLGPSYTNRCNHAVIWKGEDGWKLEFPNRRDWLVFKELYRECCDRNNKPPAVQIIPVPGVRKVLGYEESNIASFLRPDSYIVLHDDEVSRAMAKRTAHYDLDSEDEKWLYRFNSEMCTANELAKDTFELMIDAFEKAQFCSPEDYSDEKAAIDLCLDLGRREVIEAVHRYWVRRCKQKHSALIRIFQCLQPKRARMIPKSVLRKKRTFKQQPSFPGRDVVAQHEAVEEQNAMLRVEEAKAIADRSLELAGKKRKRAQVLMVKADFAIYRATMALRIVEASGDNDGAAAVAAAYFDD